MMGQERGAASAAPPSPRGMASPWVPGSLTSNTSLMWGRRGDEGEERKDTPLFSKPVTRRGNSLLCKGHDATGAAETHATSPPDTIEVVPLAQSSAQLVGVAVHIPFRLKMPGTCQQEPQDSRLVVQASQPVSHDRGLQGLTAQGAGGPSHDPEGSWSAWSGDVDD